MWNKVLLFGGNGALDKLNHHKDKTTGLHFRGVQVVRRVRGGDTVQYLDTRVAPHLRQAQFGLRVQALRYIFCSELLAPLADLGRHCFVCGARPCSVCLYHRQREIGCRTLVWSNATELRKAGILPLLRVGDVVWDTALSDEGNVGRLVWDGRYLIVRRAFLISPDRFSLA